MCACFQSEFVFGLFRLTLLLSKNGGWIEQNIDGTRDQSPFWPSSKRIAPTSPGLFTAVSCPRKSQSVVPLWARDGLVMCVVLARHRVLGWGRHLAWYRVPPAPNSSFDHSFWAQLPSSSRPIIALPGRHQCRSEFLRRPFRTSVTPVAVLTLFTVHHLFAEKRATKVLASSRPTPA